MYLLVKNIYFLLTLLLMMTLWWWGPKAVRRIQRYRQHLQVRIIRRWLYPLPFALFSFGVWQSFIVNPLPPDDQLIAHFKLHRQDIDTLVKAYYAVPEAQPGHRRVLWDASPEIQALKQRAGIRRVDHTHGYWPPNPYSIEQINGLFLFDVRKPEDRFAQRQYESLQVDIEAPDYFQPHLRYGPIWKALFYIPGQAKTSGGRIWPPISSRFPPPPPIPSHPLHWDIDLLLPDLSDFPSDWRRGQCVYRQLEVHWFIRMCRAA